MAFTHGTVGALNQSSIVRGNVGIVSGTWDSDHASSGTIVTGGTVVLAHGINVGSALINSGTVSGTAGGSATIFSNANKGGNKTTQQGSIGITAIDKSNDITGDWWAVVQTV